MKFAVLAFTLLGATAANAQNYEIVREKEAIDIKEGVVHQINVFCQNGMKVIAGGFENSGDPMRLLVKINAPILSGRTGWSGGVVNVSKIEINSPLQVWAVCTDAPVAIPTDPK